MFLKEGTAEGRREMERREFAPAPTLALTVAAMCDKWLVKATGCNNSNMEGDLFEQRLVADR